jgi:hypothetical protein
MSNESVMRCYWLPLGKFALIAACALWQLAALYISPSVMPAATSLLANCPVTTTTSYPFKTLFSFIMPVRSEPRWEMFKWNPGQSAVDALNNWEGKAKAKVDWCYDHQRASDNTVTHIAIPHGES